jgi:hypothetical protein
MQVDTKLDKLIKDTIKIVKSPNKDKPNEKTKQS